MIGITRAGNARRKDSLIIEGVSSNFKPEAIVNIAALSIPLAVPVGATAPVNQGAKAAVPAAAGKAGGPATIVSLSAKAPAASQPTQDLPTLDRDKVSNALSELSGVNGLAFLDAHLDLSLAEAKFGKAWADGVRRGIPALEYTFASVATSNAASAGIPFQNSIKSVDNVKAYAASGSSSPVISVADFSFKSGGSTYSITNQSDGTLLGTKDGQVWQTWQLSPVNSKTNFGASSETGSAPSGAAIALHTLTSLNANKASAKSLVPLDLSA